MRHSRKKQAEQLANRPYLEVIFRDGTTDGEYVYVAITPELPGTIGQGDNIDEARVNLRTARIDYIKHLLKHDLDIPEPRPMQVSPDALSLWLSSEDMLFVSSDADTVPTNHAYSSFDLRIEEDQVQVA